MPIAMSKTAKIKIVLPTDERQEKPVTFYYFYPNMRRQRELAKITAQMETIEPGEIDSVMNTIEKEVKIGLDRIENMPKGMTAAKVLGQLNMQEALHILNAVLLAMPDLSDKKK